MSEKVIFVFVKLKKMLEKRGGALVAQVTLD